jgi:hypothetical protein
MFGSIMLLFARSFFLDIGHVCQQLVPFLSIMKSRVYANERNNSYYLEANIVQNCEYCILWLWICVLR